MIKSLQGGNMKQIIFLLVITLVVGNVIALGESVNMCNVEYTMDKAVESYTVITKTPVMEDKLTYRNFTNYTAFNKAYSDYNKLEDKTKTIKPVISSYITQIPMTTKVQKTTTKTVYFIDWANFKIGTKTITTPVFDVKNETKQRIKAGYKFDTETGKFTRSEKC